MISLTDRSFWVVIVALAILVAVPVSALPTIGAASGITSNNATFTVTGASGSFYIAYGESPGGRSWYSENYTSSPATIWGAPIMGGQKYYAAACDDTGCGNEVSFTMAAITPVPTHGYDTGFNSLMSTHFSITAMNVAILGAYTVNIPQVIFYGFIMGAVILGFWRKTKSVRLVSILVIILSPLFISPQVGLMMGMPYAMQVLGALLLALGLAGVALSFAKK